MFLLPDDIDADHGVWMQAPLPSGGFKWWVAVLSKTVGLVTYWGCNGVISASKAALVRGAAGEAHYKSKIREKRSKGYRVVARFDKTFACRWVDVDNRSFLDGSFLVVKKEDNLLSTATVNLRLLTSSPTRWEILKLHDTPEGVVLRHFNSELGVEFPVWQTLFGMGKSVAEQAVRNILRDRRGRGYLVDGDTSVFDVIPAAGGMMGGVSLVEKYPEWF